MLNREAAQAALKGFKVENWKTRRCEDLAALPQSLQDLGLAVLRIGENDHRSYWSALDSILELSERDRKALLAALFPKISHWGIQALALVTQLPYPVGYTRRAFRSPHREHYQPPQRSLLQSLLNVVEGYEQPLSWYATWAAHLSYSSDSLGRLFAAAINNGDEVGNEIFEILCACARGEHEIGAMGRHITRALLVANRPEGWTLIENLLIAAQRQEGLRQTILETIDEAHPQAFERMVRIILEHQLLRFSATVRAVDVWFGLSWDVEQRGTITDILTYLLMLLDQPEKRLEALHSQDLNQVYISLWSLAFENIDLAIDATQTLLKNGNEKQRYVAAYLLRQIGVIQAKQAIAPSLVDESLAVAAQAYLALSHTLDYLNCFEELESFLQRLGAKETQIQPLVWPWIQDSIKQSAVVDDLIRQRGDRAIDCVLPYLSLMSEWGKIQVASALISQLPGLEPHREIIFKLLGDRSSYVREKVLALLAHHQYSPDLEESQILETLLTRKAADLRRGVISLLLKQPDQSALNSAQRLLQASKSPQRFAGLELLDRLQDNNPEAVMAIAQNYASQSRKRSAQEQELLDKLLTPTQETPTLKDALGLAPLTQQTTPTCPALPKPSISLVSGAAAQIVQSLDELIHQHRSAEITLENTVHREALLGNLYHFPEPNFQLSREENLAQLPLADVWQTWLQTRPPTLRDDDGFELLRAIASFVGGGRQSLIRYHYGFSSDPRAEPPVWMKQLATQWYIPLEMKYSWIGSVLAWCLYLDPPPHQSEFLLQAAQLTLAQLHQVAANQHYEWRSPGLLGWVNLARSHFQHYPHDWSESQIQQLWQCLTWIDRPQDESVPRWQQKEGESSYSYHCYEQVTTGGWQERHHPEIDELMAAHRIGAATEADVYELILGERPNVHRFQALWQLTPRKPHPLFKTYPNLKAIIAQCCDRILEVEVSRGDLPTAATEPARSLRSIQGIDWLVKLLQNFGNEKFVRGWRWDSQSKASVLSHLFRSSFPLETETPQDFANAIKTAKISQQRLVELAMYAPQWVRYIEYALGWSSLAEAVWWFHAHTKDQSWQVDSDIRELWAAQIAELTPLSSQDLLDGAVDVAWFHRVKKALKRDRWQALTEAAKYTSGGGGHKRAQLFADAMTGEVNASELVQRIIQKRYQDGVRALGLIPLPKGKKRESELLKRYQLIQEFIRGSRQFGSQRQASETLAARIALENLARTAGYPDPQRLEWAMEGIAIADLAQGGITLEIEAVILHLTITDQGQPNLAVIKNGKPLKAIPAKLRKNKEVKALQGRKKELQQQTRRIVQSLETSMCRGDEFKGAELAQLWLHPLLKPLFQRLVFVAVESGLLGFMSEAGLMDYAETLSPLQPHLSYRIAHPIDFAQQQAWHHWQAFCFRSKVVQPFKQIFRELYVLTSAEQQGPRYGSCRYSGHQVNPRQSLALLGQRGWVTHPDEGVKRTFHDHNITVWLEFAEGWYTPAEVEGFTLDLVYFCDRQTHQPIELEAVPPRLFSEVMRDLDLVVSVAHQGGVDPEASQSTVELRASLLRETCRLLKLSNIHIQEPHALIEGQLGSYSLHLGSAIVHRQPGGSLCIVPIHSQHRGRLFLPFSDDDPKSAEVISKAILLAKDQEIQDPTILEQLL